ncbi:hypothetical protein VNO78_20901 [Psophocarpus tetragonolobus]|uniref:Uncharacterized protein n=1 Tax=Psophocarpus tetragonolobus TaxID=3891 RepID=A0AAN9SAN3_PSOTE
MSNSPLPLLSRYTLCALQRPATWLIKIHLFVPPATDDVREGYFAVLATKDGESKKFIVGLHYLNNPAFLALLDQAEEEFGFRQKGALEIPCQPLELQKFLDGHRV